MPRLLSPTHPRAALAAAFALACLARPAAGQGPGAPPVPLKAPVPHQVVQRDARGFGEIPVALPDDLKGVEITGAEVHVHAPDQARRTIPGTRFVDGKIERVPTGGPYIISVTYKRQGEAARRGWTDVRPVYVGDLWILAGQSNMEGVGKLIDVTEPHDGVMALGMDGKWVRAEEPLHWLVDSPDPVHSGDPSTRAERSAKDHKTRNSGAGLGLPFAVAMVEATGVPVGLVICAHGGTSMEQWSPSKKDQGGKSLYGSMLRQVKLAGGKVKGVLWYQGESDASDKAAPGYAKTFADFIGAVRGDLDTPDLPFYFVQIGRFINDSDPEVLERHPGGTAEDPRRGPEHGRRRRGRPRARRPDPRRHAGPDAARAAAGEHRAPRAVRPHGGRDADPRPREQGAGQHADRQVQGGQPDGGGRRGDGSPARRGTSAASRSARPTARRSRSSSTPASAPRATRWCSS